MKKMTLKDKLMIYVYRKGNQIEQEEKDLKTSLRLSALDNLDHYEILRHRIRLQAWNNFIYEPIFNISTIILNIHLVEFVSTPYVSPSVPKLMRYMNNNSALIYQIALIQMYCPDFWANVVAKGNYRFDVVSRYANVRSQIQDYIFSGEFPKFNEKLDV